MKLLETIVVAIGGNSLLRKGQRGTIQEQIENARITCESLLPLVDKGSIILTHGNGPQVGAILLQNEKVKEVPGMPLDVCGAQSQGQIGYILQQQMDIALEKRGSDKRAVSLITQVLVNCTDKAFQNPTKPVGPFLTEEEAKYYQEEEGWSVKEIEGGKGWRRIVPSPYPQAILESDIIKSFFRNGSGAIIIAGGGGGVPVVKKDGGYQGVEAVIDKDFASLVLALETNADTFILLTDEEGVYLDYGTEEEKVILKENPEMMMEHLEEGQFPPGSMGPKVKAGVEFVLKTSGKTIITNAENLEKALEGKSGTTISLES